MPEDEWTDINDFRDATKWVYKNVWILKDRLIINPDKALPNDPVESRLMIWGRLAGSGLEGIHLVNGATKLNIDYPFKIKLHEDIR